MDVFANSAEFVSSSNQRPPRTHTSSSLAPGTRPRSPSASAITYWRPTRSCSRGSRKFPVAPALPPPPPPSPPPYSSWHEKLEFFIDDVASVLEITLYDEHLLTDVPLGVLYVLLRLRLLL